MKTTTKKKRRLLYVTAAVLGLLLLGGGNLLQQGAPAIASEVTPAEASRVEIAVLQPEPVKIWRPFSGRPAGVGSKRLVPEGLGAGDRVMVNGLQRVRPEMQMAPVQKNSVGGLADARERGAVNL